MCPTKENPTPTEKREETQQLFSDAHSPISGDQKKNRKPNKISDYEVGGTIQNVEEEEGGSLSDLPLIRKAVNEFTEDIEDDYQIQDGEIKKKPEDDLITPENRATLLRNRNLRL